MSFTGKILIIDDEPHVRKFVGHVARGLGAPVIVEAANGEEGLTKFIAEAPDLTLLDVNMPLMDGVQTLAAIMLKDPDAVVVMLTSIASRQMVEQCLQQGASAYVRKDTPKEAILAELAAILADNVAAN